ncbi:unnamed protein product, partial [Amoebophrya sp. A25]
GEDDQVEGEEDGADKISDLQLIEEVEQLLHDNFNRLKTATAKELKKVHVRSGIVKKKCDEVSRRCLSTL